ncbi:hypothetical protein GF322_00240 [Candidatus Dependentiae bacterium]|nr:hypothetical protein [Candidatus Dependentiae bacterium]
MNLNEFLKNIKNKNFWSKQRVLFLISANYPVLFLKKMFKKLEEQKLLPASLQKLSFDLMDNSQILSHLQQSFLGQSIFWWLGEYNFRKTDKNKLKILEFFLKYKGPNFISLYVDDNRFPIKINDQMKVEIDEKINYKQFKSILLFFEKQFNSSKINLIKNLFENKRKISIELVCSIIDYLEFVNANNVDIFQEYLLSILNFENSSLYKLTEYFFCKKTANFFTLWSKIYKDYPEIFWINFWAEKLWKAYYVVRYLKQEDFATARSLSFSLPFNFIKEDWKNVDLTTIKKSYDFLYNADFAIKTGSKFCILDLFYVNYFTNNFSQGFRL